MRYYNTTDNSADGRLSKKRMQLQGTLYGSGGAVINLDASLSYDSYGRLSSITYPNGSTYTYTYDSLSRLAPW